MTTTNHILTLKLSGLSADGAPAFSLYVNGVKTASDVAVTADFQSNQWQTFTYSYGSEQPSDSIQIVYGNDHFNSATGGDRNLYVQSVTLDGSTFQAALAKGATAATINNASTAAALYTNGSLSFASSDFKASTSTGPLSYVGVNYASAQYPSQTLTAWNQLNTYPTHDSIDYFASKGLNILRLPILWERVQPVKDGPLDASQVSQIKAVVDYAASKGITVIVDPHNFGSAYGGVIGESSTTNADFANFWGKLAGALKGSSNVMFGLMNEPHVQTATDWLGSVNAAVAAIRAAGATSQKILVPGIGWTSGSSWMTDGNSTVFANGVVDPSHNYAFEVHQYLDVDTSGTHDSVVSTGIGVERLQAVTQWAELNNQKLFLGEIGVGTDAASLAGLDNTLAYMKAHSDAWLGATYWEAGAPSPFFSIDPVNGVDKPQMKVLQKYAPGTASSASGTQAASYTVNGFTTFADGSTETKAYAANGTLIRDTVVHADGSHEVTTSAITGQSYTTERDSFNAAGVQTGIVRTHADGSLAYLSTYDPATGQKATNQYSAAGLLTTRTIAGGDGATETMTYASDGSTLLRDTQIHADHATDVYQYAIAGQSYTAEHDVTNAAGVTTAITRTHADGSLAYDYSYDTVSGTKATGQYSATGHLATRVIVGADGSNETMSYAADGTSLLKDTQVHADQSRDIDLYGITGASYAAEHDVYDAKGNQTGIIRTHADGTLAYTMSYAPAVGTKVISLYSTLGVLTTKTTVTKDGVTDTKTFGADGKTLIRQSTTNASNQLTFFYAADAAVINGIVPVTAALVPAAPPAPPASTPPASTGTGDGGPKLASPAPVPTTQTLADGSRIVSITGITGASYVAEQDSYDSKGNQTGVVRTHADGTLASRYTFDPASGTKVTQLYSATGLLTSQSTTTADRAIDTKTFASDGVTLVRDTQVHADGTMDVYLSNIAGASYVAEHDVFDRQGNQTSITRTHADGTLAYSYSYDPVSRTKVTSQYTAAGVLSATGTTYADGSTDTRTYGSDGKALLRDVQSHADGSKDVYQPAVTGKSFVAEHDVIDSGGRLAWSDFTNPDGSHTQTAYLSGQTLVSTVGAADTMTTHGGDTIRLFAGSGQDTVNGFHAGDGATHDTVALSPSVATSFAGLQQSGMITASGQDSLIHLTASDSVLLRGVAPGALTAANFLFA